MDKLLDKYILDANEAKSILHQLGNKPLAKGEKPVAVLALNCDTYELEGLLIFVGNIIELKKQWPEEYEALILNSFSGFENDFTGTLETLLEYDWAVVRTLSDSSGIWYTVYNYNCDPSGVITLRFQ